MRPNPKALASLTAFELGKFLGIADAEAQRVLLARIAAACRGPAPQGRPEGKTTGLRFAKTLRLESGLPVELLGQRANAGPTLGISGSAGQSPREWDPIPVTHTALDGRVQELMARAAEEVITRPGRNMPFWADKRPARPYESAVQNRSAMENAKAA